MKSLSPSLNLSELKTALSAEASPEKAAMVQRFFKTGKGEYGEGDRFLGVTVPVMRRWAYKAHALSFSDLHDLLESPWHEHRYAALEILVLQFSKKPQREILDFYEAHLHRVNNWDLVDTSAPYLWGEWINENPKDEPLLRAHLKSDNLWTRRVGIVALLGTLKSKRLERIFDYAEVLLDDPEDLMHKATGWVLREAGKKDEAQLLNFLQKFAAQMPRTMLRYAIERLDKPVRRSFLAIKSEKKRKSALKNANP